MIHYESNLESNKLPFINRIFFQQSTHSQIDGPLKISPSSIFQCSFDTLESLEKNFFTFSPRSKKIVRTYYLSYVINIKCRNILADLIHHVGAKLSTMIYGIKNHDLYSMIVNQVEGSDLCLNFEN